MPRPENVRIVRANGVIIPCELAHLGPDEDGVDMWEIATTVFPGDGIEVGYWPYGTGLTGGLAGNWRPVPMVEDAAINSLAAATRVRLLDHRPQPAPALITQLGYMTLGLPIVVGLWILRKLANR